VGAAPPASANPTSKIPSNKVGGAPRTLGGEPRATGSGDNADARAKAAEAAEARAQAANKTVKQGKLGGQLAEQKKQTRTDTLNQVSEENRRARDMDATTEAINYN